MAGKRGFRSGTSIKNYYKVYKLGKWEENAAKALKRHIKNQPNDTAAINALSRLDAGKKHYVRNRKSNGNICKVLANIAIKTSRGDNNKTIIQQMEDIGFKYRGRHNKRTTRQSMGRVR